MMAAAVAAVAGLAILAALIRLARGPGPSDRLVAARLAAIAALMLCAALSPDIALALALGFLPLAVAAGRLLRRGALPTPLTRLTP